MANCVDSIVVSGLFSVFNHLHEVEIKRMVRERYDIPVVMGHELTGELGIYERTVTAVLNAGLIPVLRDFLKKVQEIMVRRGSQGPDNGIQGRWHPDEPQGGKGTPGGHHPFRSLASAMGGKLLSGHEDRRRYRRNVHGHSGHRRGQVQISAAGAVVGSWPTRVEAVNVWTVGLEGTPR